MSICEDQIFFSYLITFSDPTAFLQIFVTNINNIASSTLDYINNLRSDAQAQIDR